MAQLLSGTRIYGTGTVDSQLFVSGNDVASSTITGALQVIGGAGIGGNIWAGSNINFSTSTNKIRWQTLQLAVYDNNNNGSVFLNSGNNSYPTYPGAFNATQSVVIGAWAGPGLTGTQNTMVGFGTGYQTVSGSGNTFFGASAGYGVQSGSNNVFVGAQSGTGGSLATSSSIGVGYHTLQNVTGNQNVALGFNAGSGLTSGAYNVVIGGYTATSYAALSNNILLADGQGILRASWDNTGTLTNIGQIKTTDGTNSSSTSTGALQVTGGAGIGGNLYVGGIIYGLASVTGTITTATNLSLGTAGQIVYQTAPGLTGFVSTGTAGNVLVSNGTNAPTYNNTLTLTGTSTSISTSTGALQVRGGAGIAGNLWLGGDINISTASNNLIMGNSALSSGTTNLILGRSSLGDAATIKTYAGTSTNLRIFNGVSGYHFELASYATNGWGPTGVNDGTRIRIDGATGDVKILNTSNATSTVTGALQVVGGLGVGGNLYVGGTINASVTGIVTTATTLETDPQSSNSIYYPTFVSTTTAAPSAFFNTSTFGVNPSSGAVLLGTSTIRSGALLTVNGGGYFNGVVTATIFVGSFTGTVSTATSISSGTTGQVVFQSAPNTTAFAGPGTSGQLLVSAGASATGPVFTNTSTIKVGFANAATNLDAGAAQSIVYQSGVGTTAYLAAGIAGYLLQTNGNGAAPSWVSTGSLVANNATSATNIIGGTVGQIHFQSAPNTTAFAGPGASGQLLVSAGASATGPVYTNTSSIIVGYSTNLMAGANGSIVYQSGINTTAFLAAGTAGQILQTNGAGAAPSWISTGSLVASTANNINAGTTGQIHFQSAPNTTAFAGPGASGQILVSAGASATGPVFTNTSTLRVGFADSATNLSAGTAQSIHYQSAVGVTAFLAAGTAGQILQTNGAGAAPSWISTGSLVSSTANNINGGTVGQIHFQSAASTTAFAGPGTAGQLLVSAGAVAGGPVFTNTSTLRVGFADSATNLSAGTAQSIHYQSAVGVTAFLAAGTAGQILQTNGAGAAPSWLSTGSLVASTANNINGGTVGQIHFQSAASTTAFAGPGTAGQLLVSAGASASGPVFTNTASLRVGFADSATSAANISGGTIGQIHFQSAPNTTAFAGPGTAGQLLVSAGASATGPVYTNTASLRVGFADTATNLSAGTAQSIPYQSAVGVTTFLAAGTAGQILQTNGAGSAPTWISTSSFVAGSSSLQQVVATATNATYYPTFVSANNATPISMPEYTTSSFVINPSTGWVGVGVATPLAKIHTNGNAIAGNFYAGSGSGSAGTFGADLGGSGANIVMYGSTAATANVITFGNSTGEKMRLNAAGNLGVGLTAPTSKLHVAIAGGNSTDGAVFTNGAGSLAIYPSLGSGNFNPIVQAGDQALLYTAGTINTGALVIAPWNSTQGGIRMDSSGNIGINTVTPKGKLHVSAGATSVTAGTFAYSSLIAEAPLALPGQSFITFGNTVGGTYVSGAAAIGYATNSTAGGGFGDLIFSTRFVTTDTYPSERMRIADNGFIYIGGKSGSSQLNISGYNAYGGVGYQGFLTVSNTYGSATNPNKYFRMTSAGQLEIVNNAYTAVILGLSDAGAFFVTGDITAYASDKRLKTDIRPIDNAIDKVTSLNGIVYKWNDLANSLAGYNTDEDLVGLFAQDVQAVLPQAVKPAPFDQENGVSKSGEDYLTVQYEKLVPLLIEAIKEQQTMIEQQQKQINQIHATLADLLNK